MGIGVIAMLFFTEVLPLHLLGESLFEGMDAFALIAVPLFMSHRGMCWYVLDCPTNCWISLKQQLVGFGLDLALQQYSAAVFSPAFQVRMLPVAPR